jgi:hypothetical protein
MSAALPDLFLLQESISPDLLLDWNGAQRWHWHWRPVPNQLWGSAIISSLPLRRTLELGEYDGWVVGAEIEGAHLLNSEPIVVVSLHAPSRGSGTNYVAEVDHILDLIEPMVRGYGVILGGDFNFCSLGQRTLTERYRTRTNETRVLQRLLDDLGLVNCWQERHPGEALAQTLRWAGNPMIPYHCDGIFISSRWRRVLADCRVIDGDAWRGLSDHNPTVVDLRRVD